MPANILSVMFFMFLISQLSRNGFWLGSWIRLPGTFAHELSHLIAGILFNAKPGEVNLIPQRSGRTIVLGSVMFKNITWYNGAIVGLAPFLLLFVALVLDRYARHLNDFSHVALWSFIEANFFLSAIPSRTDIKIALHSSLVPVLLIFVVVMFIRA